MTADNNTRDNDRDTHDYLLDQLDHRMTALRGRCYGVLLQLISYLRAMPPHVRLPDEVVATLRGQVEIHRQRMAEVNESIEHQPWYLHVQEFLALHDARVAAATSGGEAH